MNELILTTYGVLFVGLMWFIRGRVNAYDEHLKDGKIHQSENERNAIATTIQLQFESHERLDSERFGHIKETMELILAEVRKPR